MSYKGSIAVFCGGRPGVEPSFSVAAAQLGRGIAKLGFRLVYGGGGAGIMGALAEAVLTAGGEVVGVIPEFLMTRESVNRRCTNLIVTPNMHLRKRRMFDMADAFVAMPGGLGTLDETFEMLTWRQLGLHDKPILICDVAGSAAPLLDAISNLARMGFVASPERFFEVFSSIDTLLARFPAIRPQAASGADLMRT